MQAWTHPCDTDFSTPQLSETGHIKNLYLHHSDTYVAGKTGLGTFQDLPLLLQTTPGERISVSTTLSIPTVHMGVLKRYCLPTLNAEKRWKG